MTNPTDQLVVRQHERYACRISLDMSVAADSPTRVALSRSVGSGTGVVGATLVDCSAGGVGIESPIFLPRQSRLVLRIPADADTPAIELDGVVQRVSMISREPRYYVGLSFGAKNPSKQATIEDLMKRAARSDAATMGAAA